MVLQWLTGYILAADSGITIVASWLQYHLGWEGERIPPSALPRN